MYYFILEYRLPRISRTPVKSLFLSEHPDSSIIVFPYRGHFLPRFMLIYLCNIYLCTYINIYTRCQTILSNLSFRLSSVYTQSPHASASSSPAPIYTYIIIVLCVAASTEFSYTVYTTFRAISRATLLASRCNPDLETYRRDIRPSTNFPSFLHSIFVVRGSSIISIPNYFLFELKFSRGSQRFSWFCICQNNLNKIYNYSKFWHFEIKSKMLPFSQKIVRKFYEISNSSLLMINRT